MARVTNSRVTKRRHKKVLKAAKGYVGARSRLYKSAREAVNRGRQYAYRDRRKRKGDFRSLWVIRINAAARTHGMSYSRLMWGLRQAGVAVDRKVLADLAVNDPAAFSYLVDVAKTELSSVA